MNFSADTDEARPRVYVVDDDPSARESLCWLLQTEGFETAAFKTADAFLSAWNERLSGCITVDIRMPGKSGLQLQQELNDLGNRMPIIILTGHADVPIAIKTMKAGAFDFLEKPYSDEALLVSVKSALELGRRMTREEAQKRDLGAALGSLTDREREVMRLVVEGDTNKTVASKLGISEKTVEIHRSRVMQKTGAKSLSALVRISLICAQE